MPAVHRYTKNGSFAPGFLPPLVQTPPQLSSFRLDPIPFGHQSHHKTSLPPLDSNNVVRSNSEPILNASDKPTKSDEQRRKRKNNRRRTDMFRDALENRYRPSTPFSSPKIRLDEVVSHSDLNVSTTSSSNNSKRSTKSVKFEEKPQLIEVKRPHVDQNNNNNNNSDKKRQIDDRKINRSGSLLNMRIPRGTIRHRVYKPLPKPLPQGHTESVASDTPTSTTSTATTAESHNKHPTEQKDSEAADKSSKSTKKEHLSPEEQEAKDQENEDLVKHSAHVTHVHSRKDVAAKYHFRSIIGEGNFATVLKVMSMSDSNQYAIKEVDKKKLNGKLFYIENEVDLLCKCHHPNIIKVFEAFQTPESYFIVMELMQNGDLFDTIKAQGCLTERRTARIVKDLASALSYLHGRKIAHRDIKPENVLLASNFHVKLIDFGLACRVTGPLRRVCGTPTYVAPEVLAETGYGVESDMWSLGILLYIMLVGYAPFRHENRAKLFQLIQHGKYSITSTGWDKISKGAINLVSRLLVIPAKDRYTATQVLQDKWLKESQIQAINSSTMSL